MTTYVRIREDASSAISLGLMPGASYPMLNEGAGLNLLRVLNNSGDHVQVPRKFLEIQAA